VRGTRDGGGEGGKVEGGSEMALGCNGCETEYADGRKLRLRTNPSAKNKGARKGDPAAREGPQEKKPGMVYLTRGGREGGGPGEGAPVSLARGRVYETRRSRRSDSIERNGRTVVPPRFIKIIHTFERGLVLPFSPPGEVPRVQLPRSDDLASRAQHCDPTNGNDQMMAGRFEEAIYLEELHFLHRREVRE